MSDPWMTGFFDRLAPHAGTPPLDDAEAEGVLLLAKLVAHGHERRFAPLTTYAAGLVIGAGTPPQARAQRVREIIDAVRALGPTDG